MRALFLQTFKAAAIYFLLCLGTLLMLRSILRYTAFDDGAGFLALKQPYVNIPLWKAAFYTHVFSSLLTLLAGFIQFSTQARSSYPRLHRWMGRVYVAGILLVNVPAGFVLAVYANGGIPSKIAFVLLDVLWAVFTWKGYSSARSGNFHAHRDFMIRSYALTLSALTLRSWKIVFFSFTALTPALIYQIDAWLGFVPNLLLAEWMVRHRRSTRSSPDQRRKMPIGKVRQTSVPAAPGTQ
ncbi:MAG: DUF2306 domain-containing protein [Chitinophagaceae bacterium]|nr:MAG: DUF2306 domain-containing protein [Chitinophagaceae bacterium]